MIIIIVIILTISVKKSLRLRKVLSISIFNPRQLTRIYNQSTNIPTKNPGFNSICWESNMFSLKT